MRRLENRIRALETDIRRRKISKRFEQVMALYNQVCISNPYQINVKKITKPVELINLAWILAVCSLRKLSFKSTELIALKINIYKKLLIMVNELTIENKLEQSVVNEVQLHNKNSYQEIYSYIIPPEVAILLISEEPDFHSLCINAEIKSTCKESKQAKEERLVNCLSSEELSKENIYSASDHDRPSAKTTSKCEFIVEELENIAISLNEKINRSILWNILIQKCADNPRFKLSGGSQKKYVIERVTENQWDRDSLNYHMDRVIEWHKQLNPQLYSRVG